MTDQRPTRPPLKWRGSKWRIAPWIIGLFPDHNRYVEPFGGGASVLLRKPRTTLDVYNDLDGEVVNLFQVMRSDRASELIESVRLTPFARQEFNEAYTISECPVERARRMLVRSHMGFGGAGSTGLKKSGFRARDHAGSPGWKTLPDALYAVVDRMSGVVIESKPALDIIEQQDHPNTLIYLDPPYLPETRDKGKDYAVELTAEDHAQLLDRIKRASAKIAISGYPSNLYDNVLRGWNRFDRNTLALGARPRVEVLWTNYDPTGKAML